MALNMTRSIHLPRRLGGSPSSLFNHGAYTAFRAPSTSTASFSTTAPMQMKAKGRKRKRVHRDPYHEAQAAQLKAANKARQEVLKKERAATLGDPVRAKHTPFVRTLREPVSQDTRQRNFFTTSDEAEQATERAKFLSAPLPNESALSHEEYQELLNQWQKRDEIARIALERITSLENGSNKDKTRVDIQRCIEEFGRHNTDKSLPPRPQGPAQSATPPAEHLRLRAGPDTGSSEVQVAILTAKIEKLADHVAQVGHKDKHNKRNLRVLVHKRQKLLAYVRQKERGGPRWVHLMEKLGLSDGAWKGEISL